MSRAIAGSDRRSTRSSRSRRSARRGAGDAAVPSRDARPSPTCRRARCAGSRCGDLDVLLAHTTVGIVAVDDRCPHMAAPLSIGELDGCVVACPLHYGRFDLASGDPVQMPTTGGLFPTARYHPSGRQPGREPKDDPPGKKAEARRLTRVRRFRYYPVRIVDGVDRGRASPPDARRRRRRPDPVRPGRTP